MADFGKKYNQHHGQEVERRNETGIEEYDSNNMFGNNIFDDILKEIENYPLSDDPFPALSNLPLVSHSSPSSSSVLHWPCQPDQIRGPNMHPDPDSMIQEPDRFDYLDSFLFPNDLVAKHKDPEMDQPGKLIEGNTSGTAPPTLLAPPPILLASPPPTSNQSDPDIARMFLDWLKLNRDSISQEDLKTITLNKATVEYAAARLGNSKEGKMKLLQLILTWVQEHRLCKNKPPQIKTPKPLCGYNSQPSNTQPFSSQLPPPPPPQTVEQYVCSTPKEARKRRMDHMRRLSDFRHHKTNIIKPISEVESGTSTRFCKYDSKIHNLRTNWQYKLQNDANIDLVNMHPTILNVRHSIAAFMERKKARKQMEPKLLFQKALKQTDVGRHGRIILPKKEAEKHMPELKERDLLPLPMLDMNLLRVWELYYRFWPNNNSRMYVLERTSEFVRSNGLQEGDILAIYFDIKNNIYVIEGRKKMKAAVQSVAVESCKDQKISCEMKNKSIIEGDNYLIEIPSDSDED